MTQRHGSTHRVTRPTAGERARRDDGSRAATNVGVRPPLSPRGSVMRCSCATGAAGGASPSGAGVRDLTRTAVTQRHGSTHRVTRPTAGERARRDGRRRGPRTLGVRPPFCRPVACDAVFPCYGSGEGCVPPRGRGPSTTVTHRHGCTHWVTALAPSPERARRGRPLSLGGVAGDAASPARAPLWLCAAVFPCRAGVTGSRPPRGGGAPMCHPTRVTQTRLFRAGRTRLAPAQNAGKPVAGSRRIL